MFILVYAKPLISLFVIAEHNKALQMLYV